MKAGLVITLVLAGNALVGSSAGFAQAAGDLSIEVGECVALTSAEERYACFERQVDAARTEEAASANDADALGAQSSRSTAVPSPARELASTIDAADRPGGAQEAEQTLEAEQTQETEQTQQARPTQRTRQAEQTEQIVSAIAALDEVLPNRYLVTLENGQTWRQMTSQRYPLRVGRHVRVYPTRWGNSYRLTTEDSKGFIQVERVR